MSGQGNNNTSYAARQTAQQVKGQATNLLGSVNTWAGSRLWGGARVLWATLAILALAGGLWYITRPDTSPTGVAGGGRGGPGGFGQPSPVGVATAKTQDVRITLNALGTVNPMATAQVKPQVGGMLLALRFTEGQMVKKGDVLAEIDARAISNTLETARATLARDSATLANGQLDLKRQEALAAANATSPQALNQQKTVVAQQQAAVRSDEANVRTQEINLSYTKVTAPFDGRVGLKAVDIGNLVSANSTNIVTVTQVDPISVVFSLPEDSVRQVQTQVAEGKTLTVEAWDRAQSKMLASGSLQAIDNTIDTTTGTVKLRGMFQNPNGVLFPNQFVNVRLQVDVLPNQVVIPSAAVMLGAAGKYVFVVTPDPGDAKLGTVSMRTVVTGVTDADNIAITEGLKVGESVVTDGADRLREGSQVAIPDPNAQKEAAQGMSQVAAAGGPGQNAGGIAPGGQGRGFGGGGQGGGQGAGSNAQREMQMAVMQRLTQEEREAMRGITDRAERNAKIRAYFNDAKFMARKPDPNAFGRGGAGGRGGEGGRGGFGGGGGFGGPGGGGGRGP